MAISFKIISALFTALWLLLYNVTFVNRYELFLSNSCHGYVLFVVITSPSFPHSCFCHWNFNIAKATSITSGARTTYPSVAAC